MKITIRELKQLIKEQMEEEVSPMNARKLGDSEAPKSAQLPPPVAPSSGMQRLAEAEKIITVLESRIEYLEKQVQRLNKEATEHVSQ